ncbi:ERMES complex subunit mmm1, partial [Coemansia spiralis]
ITLGFDTRVLVNWPRPTIAALPVSMVASLVKFAGTLAVTFDCASTEPSLAVSILPDYVLEFDVQTLIGSKAKVQNLPMLTSVISRKLQAAFAKELVTPNEKQIRIKHPFMASAADQGLAAGSAAGAAAGTHGGRPRSPGPSAMLQSPSLASQHHGSHKAPRLPRPGGSPIGPLVAELPPDYNTQLPPPHPLRSTVASRAAAPSSIASPPAGHLPHMFASDDPAGHAARPVVGGSTQQQFMRPWSPDSQLHPASPLLRPLVGISSASPLGAALAGSRMPNVGPRFPGSYDIPLHSPGLAPASGTPSTLAPARLDATSHGDLHAKDSVRQRVGRVIRTANEA